MICCLGLQLLVSGNKAQAQIIPDNSLPNASIVNQDGLLREIRGGTRREANLFHSFTQFSVGQGETAFFDNALDIENIFARITGNTASNIDGILRANGSANLFLLNPNGILFGPEAQLDIGGSFFASTADSLRFGDGREFSAVNPTSSLLSVSVPIGLQYGVDPGPIAVAGSGNNLVLDPDSLTIIRDDRPSGLQVQPGQTLALLGGDIQIRGGNLTAAAGQIELGSVANAGAVTFRPTATGWDFNYSEVEQFGNIRLRQAASVDTSGAGGGELGIHAQRLTVFDGSALLAITRGDGTGRGLSIATTDAVVVDGISVDEPTGEILFPSGLYTDVDAGAMGNGGNLRIEGDRLLVAGGGQVSSTTFGPGRAGDVQVNVRRVDLLSGVPVIGSSGIFANVDLDVTGQGGNVFVTADQLNIFDGAVISASTFGPGNSGNLILRANQIEMQGTSPGGFPSGVFAQVEVGASGDSGRLVIQSPDLRLADGAQIASGTFGDGSAGDVLIETTILSLSGISPVGTEPTALFAGANPGSTGDGGNLSISTGQLRIRDGAQVIVSTGGPGDAGTLSIRAQTVDISGASQFGRSGLFASAVLDTGAGGNIWVRSDRITLSDGAIISASNFSSLNPSIPPGQGPAGSIQIDGQTLSLDNDSRITASTAVGAEGNVTLRLAESLSLSRGSRIATDSQGTEPGGNITIETRFLTAQGNSDITANAVNAQGGRIIITAEGIFGTTYREQLTPRSDITASSELGPAFSGVVELNTPEADPSLGLVELPNDANDPADDVVTACERFQGNELLVTGRGGIPEDGSQFRGATTWRDVRLTEAPGSTATNPAATTQQQPNETPDSLVATDIGEGSEFDNSSDANANVRLVEAQGWSIDVEGQVHLVGIGFGNGQMSSVEGISPTQCVNLSQ
jgi:filamentous hemagglutinin family protein